MVRAKCICAMHRRARNANGVNAFHASPFHVVQVCVMACIRVFCGAPHCHWLVETTVLAPVLPSNMHDHQLPRQCVYRHSEVTSRAEASFYCCLPATCRWSIAMLTTAIGSYATQRRCGSPFPCNLEPHNTNQYVFRRFRQWPFLAHVTPG
eukprot:COSAG02_NODE_19844_length_862_cov_0.680210_2_plen_150_part_01